MCLPFGSDRFKRNADQQPTPGNELADLPPRVQRPPTPAAYRNHNRPTTRSPTPAQFVPGSVLQARPTINRVSSEDGPPRSNFAASYGNGSTSRAKAKQAQREPVPTLHPPVYTTPAAQREQHMPPGSEPPTKSSRRKQQQLRNKAKRGDLRRST